MIFLSEQPQTGMNEGTWFTQGMCINQTMNDIMAPQGNSNGPQNILRWRRQSLQMSRKISVCLRKCIQDDALMHFRVRKSGSDGIDW